MTKKRIIDKAMEVQSGISSQTLKVQDIRAIIQRYFNNTCTEDEMSLIQYWYTLLSRKINECTESPIPLEQRIWDNVAANF